MRRETAAGVIAITLAAGCSDAGLDYENLDEAGSAIINGQLDTTHQAVVFVYSSGSACSGTIIHKTGVYAHVLTAAHCIDTNAPELVIQGNDYNSPDYIYNVVDYDGHNGYPSGGSAYDFAMVRITGAGPATPTIPVATPPDGVNSSTTVTHVGYGLIGAQPDVSTSLRHYTSGSVSGTTQGTVTFNTQSSGPCFGDSGGPNLTTGSEQVIGVNSTVSDNYCNGFSTSGRASWVWDSFINPFINKPLPAPTCESCVEAATTGAGTCIDELTECLKVASCNNLWQCIEGCSDQTCITQCADDHPYVVTLYNAAISGCACATACPTECAGDPVCTPVSTSGTGGTGNGGSGAGTGLGGSSSGTGGSGATDGEGVWIAGDNDNNKYTGVIVGSGCRYAGSRGTGALGWLAALAFAAGLRRRRRD